MKKNESADKVIFNMVAGHPAYVELFTTEFKTNAKLYTAAQKNKISMAF